MRATLAAAVAGAALASVPLVRSSSTVRQFEEAMQAALGKDYLQAVSAETRVRMRSAPIVFLDLIFRPFTSPDSSGARVVRNIPLGNPGGVPLSVDIYRPAAEGLYPSVVQIYGGAWQRGVPSDDAGFASYLAARGFVVFAIDYRHAPQWQWPSQIEDVRAALGWVRAHGSEYGADTSRLALLGRSAGAQLALIAAYELDAPSVQAVVSYYGPVDLEDGYRHPPRPDPLDVSSIEEALLGGTPDQVLDRYRQASPISYVSHRAPPSLLIYGRHDHVVLPRFGAQLNERLRMAGVTSVYLEIPWAEHAFDLIPNGLSGQLSLYFAERFLAWALTRPVSKP